MAGQVIAPGEPLKAGPKRKKVRDTAPKGRWFQEVGWRHLVGIIACIWALFPISYIVSAALNPLGNVVTTSSSGGTSTR
jgi:arabinogalactan oligomer/maltooligosaccharide transport system permease protein